MKLRNLLGFCLVLSSGAIADVGIGVSMQNDDSRIYIPIDLTDSIRLEPLVRYYKTNSDNGQSKSTQEVSEVGMGLFKMNSALENLTYSYGIRLAYVSLEQTWESDYYDETTSESGYSVAPTLGFEYFLSDKFSIGSEIALAYTFLDGSSKDYEYSEDTDSTSIDTDTAVIIRFYF